MLVETVDGLPYTLRFGEFSVGVPAAASADAPSNTGEKLARDLTNRLVDWYYLIAAPDFAKLHLKRKDLVR